MLNFIFLGCVVTHNVKCDTGIQNLIRLSKNLPETKLRIKSKISLTINERVVNWYLIPN